jgi:multidrug efflux system outer membrane protein
MERKTPTVMKNRFIFLSLLLLLSQCKLGPNYQRPEVETPESYRNDFPSNTSIADLDWWEMFEDPVLQTMIDRALLNNRDLKAAAARITEAEAVTGIVRADLYPRVNYGGDIGAKVTSQDGDFARTGGASISMQYQVDLWGRFRRLNEAALEEYLATEEAYRSITISLVAAVASSYILLRDLDNRLMISERTAETWQANLDIIEARFRAGFVSEVDLNQAIIQLSEAEASIESLTRARDQTENAICVLMGIPPQRIPRGRALQEQIFPPSMPAGIPSELLSRRPDILQAERRLHAQTARIGAAEALKYPQLTLTADLGASFANPAFGLANVGAQIFGPLLNSGAAKRGVEIEIARTEQLLQNYEQAFLLAVQETEDAMIAVQTLENEYQARLRQMNAANQAVELSWVRYNGGLTSYLEVLDLQRSQFSSQLKASETLQNQLNATINLYKALGGGWTDIPADSLN